MDCGFSPVIRASNLLGLLAHPLHSAAVLTLAFSHASVAKTKA
jgi:hypothetical protein